MRNMTDSGTRMVASLMQVTVTTTVLFAAVQVQAGAPLAPTAAAESSATTKPHILHFMADGQCIYAVAAPLTVQYHFSLDS